MKQQMKYLVALLAVLLSTLTVAAQTQTTHEVQRGETIESIAQKYGVTTDAIIKANPDAETVFFVGMKLRIPAAASTNSTETVAPASGTQPSVNTVSVTPQTEVIKPQTSAKGAEEPQLGLQFRRIKASYYFPTQMEKSERGHYRSSYMLSFTAEGEYVFTKNLFTSFGLGVVGSGSANSDQEGIANYFELKTSYTSVMLPLSIGFRSPITSKSNFDVYTGPVLAYTVSGYTKYRHVGGEWTEIKLSDNKDAERFNAYWTIGARVNLWGIDLGVEYLHMLSKTMEGAAKGAIAAYFAFEL